MTDKDKNINKVPNLRFPEFTNEWKQTFLKEIAEKVNTKNNDEKIDLVFSNSAVQGIVLQNDYFDKSIANKNNLNGYYVVKPFDFVYNPRISASAEVGAMNVNKTNETGLVSPLYTVFRLKYDNIENPFLEFLFKSKVWHNYMRSIANYGARDDRMNVKNEDFFEMPLLIPGITEQKKIVDFLSSVENKIQTQKKTIEELNAFKKGIAKKIFSQQLRFKDDNGNDFPEWKIKTIQEVFYSEKGKGLSKDKIDENGEYECILYGELYTQYGEIIKNIVSKTNYNEGLKSEIGDILIPSSTTTSGIDLANVTALNKENILLGGDITVLRSKKDVNNIFYAYYLSLYKKREIANLAQGVTIIHLYFSHLKNMEIDFPTIREQQKIANFLSSIDSKIDIENQILQKLEEQKKYFLANLFI